MRYISRYKEDADFWDIVVDYPILSSAKNLPYVYMFIFDTDDENLVIQLQNDPRINYVQEDRKVHGTDYIEEQEYEEVEDYLGSQGLTLDVEDATPTENGWGYNTPTTAITTSNGGIYYYWHLEHITKRDLSTHSTYHTYSYIYDGNGVDAYVIDSGINKGHPHLRDASNNARAFGLPGHGGDDGVTGVEITTGGSSYTHGQAVSFSGGGGSSAAGTVTVSSGVVTGVSISNFGSGYTSAPSITFPAGGSNAAGTVTIGNDDDNSHGTQCALCVGGNGRGSPQGQYGPGVAKEIKFYAVKVLDWQGSGWSSVIASGINAVIAHNTSTDPDYKGSSRPSVINFSIGHSVPNSANPKVYEDITGSRTDTNDILEDALKTATSPSSGNTLAIHVVQSAGNGFDDGGSEWYGPMQAKYNIGTSSRTTAESGNTDTGQGVPICVGATQEFDTGTVQLNMAYFSNYGASATTIMTSGKSVLVPKWDWTVGAGNTVYSLISGTSFASPIIAGLVALRLGNKPTETPADLKAWLTNGTTGATNPNRILEIMVAIPLSPNPISTTASSSTVSVNWVGHNLTTGNLVQINDSTIVEGLPANDINGWWTVTVVDVDNFTFTSSVELVLAEVLQHKFVKLPEHLKQQMGLLTMDQHYI